MIKLLPGEDRTGEVWFPYGTDPTMEAFLIIGEPTVKKLHETGKRRLFHPVLHIESGRTGIRVESSRPGWVRNYVCLQRP